MHPTTPLTASSQFIQAGKSIEQIMLPNFSEISDTQTMMTTLMNLTFRGSHILLWEKFLDRQQ
jgi:hypothetical protein